MTQHELESRDHPVPARLGLPDDALHVLLADVRRWRDHTQRHEAREQAETLAHLDDLASRFRTADRPTTA